ncbi:MAG: sulfotransferase domain-containing protein [Dehalococcoidia bacterium]
MEFYPLSSQSKQLTFPDFLCIGAQKAGTTWLYRNIHHHPQIWLAPIKELHYFDRSRKYPSMSFLANDSRLKRFSNRQWLDMFKRRMKRHWHQRRRSNWRTLAWDLKFFFGKYSDEWYASLFKAGQGKMKGEITPAYSILEPEEIEHISQIMPNVRLIYLLRNPIDRDWSSVRFAARSNPSALDSYTYEDFVHKVHNDWSLTRSEYVSSINNWTRFFPKEQLFIGFIEDIIENPQQLILNVFEFLGVEPNEKYIHRRITRPVNVSPEKEMPLELKLYLSRLYQEQIRCLSEMIGGRAVEWRREVEGLLEAHPSELPAI